MANNNSNNNCKGISSNNVDNSISQKQSIGLDKFSYADFVVLSSVISYAIAEELSEIDLELLVSFLGMISADLALLIIKKGLEEARLNETLDTTAQETIEESTLSQLGRKNNFRKVKRIKKVKYKKKK